jgi:hypothetical protein
MSSLGDMGVFTESDYSCAYDFGGHHKTMRDKPIPVEKSFSEWRKDPAYRSAYAALDDEFAEAASKIAGGAVTGKHPIE